MPVDIKKFQSELNIESKILDDPSSSSSSGTGSFQWGIRQDGASNPQILVFNGIVIFIYIISIIAALSFVYAGVKYITAGGDAEKAESGKKMMVGSIIGIIIISASFILFNIAVDVLGSAGSAGPALMDKIY